MKRSLLLMLVGMFYSINLFALPPKIQFDILKTKLTGQLKANEYTKALHTMDEIKALGIKVPKSFTYFEGKALFESGEYAASYKKLEQYIGENGQKGKYYQQAISYLIKAEEEKEKSKKNIFQKHSDNFVRLMKDDLTKFTSRDLYGTQWAKVKSIVKDGLCKFRVERAWTSTYESAFIEYFNPDFSKSDISLKENEYVYKRRREYVLKLQETNGDYFYLHRIKDKDFYKYKQNVGNYDEKVKELKSTVEALNRLCKEN